MMNKILYALLHKNSSIKEAMRFIDKGGMGIAFVVNSKNEIAGSVTDGDIRRAILRGAGIEESITGIMNTDPLVAGQDWDFFRIKKFIKSKIVRAKGPFEHLKIPVIDKGGCIVDILLVSGDEFLSLKKSKKIENIKNGNVKRVLVIGGAGYIGSVLARLLLARNYEVSVLDSFIFGSESLEGIKNRKDLRIIKGDTRHIEDITEAMRDVDAVVHLAEIVGDPACDVDPEETIKTNYLATRLIASMCKYFQINRLVYASSYSVYDASESEEPIHEESELNPISLYSKMKLESEKALLEMSDDNFSPTIFRLAAVYGKSHRPRFDLLVNSFTAKAVYEKNISFFGGDQIRPNVHVEDVGRAVIRALELPIYKVGGQIFNIGGTGENHTIRELAYIIQKTVPSARIIEDNKKIEKRSFNIDFTKAKTELRFISQKKVEDGARQIKKLIEAGKINYKDKKYSNIEFLRKKMHGNNRLF